jgi:anti-sigma B factor antagonist
MLSFTTSEVKGVLVVAFEATDDGASDWQAGQRDWLYKLIETHPGSRFAIDLSDVNYLASSEIGFLVTLKRRIDRRQGKVVIFGAQPYVTDLFRTMNLVRFLDLVDSLPAALTWLETAGRAAGPPVS